MAVRKFLRDVASHHMKTVGVNPLRTKALETLKLVKAAEANGIPLIKGNASVDIFPTYPPLVEAHIQAVKDISQPPHNNYGMPMIQPRLAAVVSNVLPTLNGATGKIDESRIFAVSGGCSNAQNIAAHVLNRTGKLVFGVTAPFFVISEGIVKTQGVGSKRVGFSIRGELAETDLRTFLAVTLGEGKTPYFLADTGNPTGQALSPEYAQRLEEIAAEFPGTLLALDHLYTPMTHGKRPTETLFERFSNAENAFHFTSLGKPLGSTQARVGIGVVPDDPDLIEAFKQTLAFQTASPEAASQIALATVLEDFESVSAFLASRNAILHERALYVAERVAKIGTEKVTMEPIQSGIYGLMDVSKLGVTGEAFADLCFNIGLVINDAAVLGAPDHVRISIGDGDVLPAVFDKIEEAVDLLVNNGFEGAMRIAEEMRGK